MTPFTHLHLHSEYSLLDGACRIKKVVESAKKMGQTALAITDHGVMYGAIDFYKTAKAAGIQPIIGCEVYVARRTRFDREHHLDSSPFHLILLCENNQGYQNLIKLVSLGFLEGFYGKPRVDMELLRTHHEGLIALSACLAGEIPRLLTGNEYDKAKEAALTYESIFGKEHFYLEMQNHGIIEEEKNLPFLRRLSKETGIPLVVTNDCHYIEKKDAKMQKVLTCIQMNQTVYEKSGLGFSTPEFYLKSGDEMAALFPNDPEALSNTMKIAKRCDVSFTFGQTKLPYFSAPGREDNLTYFRRRCQEGLSLRYGSEISPTINERLQYEIDTISTMGYIDYFLIVEDFIAYAKRKGIPVGPGRGSGAGSLCAYCIGITDIDPIRYGLIFERFLNPERITMPDFDIDFCYERRGEVIDYVVGKYGSDHVAQIVTFGTMAARGSIRDVGRALDIPYKTVDTVAKTIPMEIGMTLEKAQVRSKELAQLIKSDPKIGELFSMAKEVEGMPRHASTHAAGVVITREPVDHYVPLSKNDDAIVTQFPMTTLEELGLLKMDFLGLRNLTVIRDAEVMIQKNHPNFSISHIPMDDNAVYEMLSKGNCKGVFQFESAGIRRVMEGLKPDHFEDLIAVISLYRPGPMDSIPRYIEGRHHQESVRYTHPLLKPILEVTYGCIVYQEQVMQIFRDLAGYSYGRADLVRRAMSKKKHDVMERERQGFVHGIYREDGSMECEGAMAKGVNESTANRIFDDMASFASYAFNKSHAAAYALLSYQTAYLKCHFPQAFFAALLTSVFDFTPKMVSYITEAEKANIQVLPPDINKSSLRFTAEGKAIRFGLLAIKNLGRGVIEHLLSEREGKGPFSSFFDFCLRMSGKGLNKRALEGLITSGAFDLFGNTRQQLMQNVDRALGEASSMGQIRQSGQTNLFDLSQAEHSPSFTMSAVPEFSPSQLLRYEKDTVGLYLTGHPLKSQADLIARLKTDSIGEIVPLEGEIPQYRDNQTVCCLVIVDKVKRKNTKKQQTMAFVMVEDESGEIEVLFFPAVWDRFAPFVEEGAILLLNACVSLGEDENTKLIAESVKPLHMIEGEGSVQPAANLPAATLKKASKPGLYLKLPSEKSHNFQSVKNLLAVFEGDFPVYVYFADQKKLTLAPRKLWVTSNSVLLGELSCLLGEKNVVLQK